MYIRRQALTFAAALIGAAVLFFVVAPRAGGSEIDDAYAGAAEHYAAQRYEQAIAGFRAFLAAHEDHKLAASARFFLAESLLQQGDAAAAGDEFRRFAKDYPHHRLAVQASFRVGEAAYLQGKHDEAIVHLGAFVTAHQHDALCAYALPYLGEARLARRDIDGAQQAFQLGLKGHPGGPLATDCRLGLGRCAEERGDVGEARRFYGFVAARESSLRDEAQLRLGRLCYEERDYHGAEKHLRPLADGTETTEQRAAARYWLGQTLLSEEQAPAAAKLWERGIQEDAKQPLTPAMALALAQFKREAGELEEARAQCQKAIAAWPKSEYADDIALLQVQLAYQAGDDGEAIAQANVFVESYARSPLLRLAREAAGYAQLRRGEHDAAVETFQELLKLPQERGDELRYALALAQLGAKAYADALATIEAIDAARLTIEVQGELPALAGAAHFGLEQFDAALPLLAQYLEKNAEGAKSVQCRAQQCIALAKTHEFTDALAAWRLLRESPAREETVLTTTRYLADQALAAREYKAAKIWYEHLASGDGQNAYRKLGAAGLAAIERAQGDGESPSIEKAPAGAGLAAAQKLERNGKKEAALAAYLALTRETPAGEEHAETLLAAGRLHDELQQDREAEAVLSRLLREYPDFSRRDVALYQSAWVWLDLERPNEAQARFETLHRDFVESRYWADATYRLAELKLRGKAYDEAQTLLARLMETKLQDDLLCHALFLQGQAAAKAEQWDNVAAPLARLTREFPRHALAALAEYWQAEADYRRGKWDDAGVRLGKLSVSLEGRASEPWMAMVPLRQAQVLAQQNRWAAARELAQTIEKQHPHFRQQYEVDYLLGRCFGAEAKFAAAREAYQRVLRSPGAARSETAAMAQWMIGETYFQQEKYDEAIQAYHRVARAHEHARWQAAALLQAGKCHETQGQWREAVQLYAQVMKEFPDIDHAAEAAQRLRVAQERSTKSRR